ncbi:hypothetical protein N8J89_16715 [Crossiella sp. CA-258035]|uniref:hypothetical protein n=1 Tax=Crossiella sp. CA-258035 TaxID=2981138 RepID=UPI0024BC21DD|nr:hypothetical protein [Crossiella sp. CA-258035]WHT22641.1 hypothetical protein N8J89_16715 [Crossiella sp. CA-258035]
MPTRTRLLAALTALGVICPAGAASASIPSPPLPGDLPISTAEQRTTTTSPGAPTAAMPGFTIPGPFNSAGTFGARQQSYLDMLTARARLTTVPQRAGTQPGLADLRWNLAGHQAQRDAQERADLNGANDNLAALQQRLRTNRPTGGLWTDLTRSLPGLGLPADGLPKSMETTVPQRGSLAMNLLTMPSLNEVSGGRAIDPTAFIAGRAGVVDACRSAIAGRIQDVVPSGGRAGEAGRCLDTPVGLTYQQGPAFDPERFRKSLDGLAAKPPTALAQRHRENQERAQNPPPPPKLPDELTRSISPCRRFHHTLDGVTEWVPPFGVVNNGLEHLCLLAGK